MRPIYETAGYLAHGWLGHHPSRADTADAAATRWLNVLCLRCLEHRSTRHKSGCEIAPERDHQLARQRHDGDALDALAGVERAPPVLLGECTVWLMPQP